MNELRVEPQSNRRRKRRTAGVPEKTSLPWKNIRNSLPPIEPLSADEIESIHQASLRVLAELGMKVTDVEARKIYTEGGARVDQAEEMVYLDPEMVEEALQSLARNRRIETPYMNIQYDALRESTFWNS